MPRRAIAAAVAVLALPLALLAVLHSPRARLEHALATLPQAHQLPLWLGCGLFVVSLICSACAWRTTLAACGPIDPEGVEQV
jgi:protein-S-isoprenylcysteine O-methyltransferase Ste14